MQVKIFLSWSKARSSGVAECLHSWLPNVLQIADPWISTTGIRAGVDFAQVLRQELAEADFGIIFLTKENCRSPWMLFEAGAVAKAFSKANLCPYLIDLEPSELPSPLSLFQAVSADETGTLKLVNAINSASDSITLSGSRVQLSFEQWWPKLKAELEELEKSTKVVSPASTAETFLIYSVKYEKFLQATGAKRKNGTALKLVAFNGDSRQKWSFHGVDSKTFVIGSMHTEQFLDGTSSKEDAKVHQWEFHGGKNQRWVLDIQPTGDFRVRCEHNLRCLTYNENGFLQKGEINSRTQLWRLVPTLE